jgi:phosphate transport system substrate-binding protein
MRSRSVILILVLLTSIFSISPAVSNESFKGAGSTFSANFVDQCRVMYAKQTGNTLTYTPNGSGAGRNFFNNKLVDFAISDTPYSSADRGPAEDFIYVPLVSGPVAVVYNLPEYKTRLKLSKEVLAKIFAGQITMWNDPQIQKLNATKLPKLKITVVYRSDGSGTSEVFTSYLNSVAPEIWNKPGSKTFVTVFPGNINDYIGYYQGVNGSTQIAFTQATLPGSISYNEVSYVRGMQSALIENEAGRFMAPTINAASSFLSSLKFNKDGTAILNYRNPSKTSYNISTFAYGIAYINTGEKATVLKDFLTFAVTKCNKIEGYASISGNALKAAKTQIAKINK